LILVGDALYIFGGSGVAVAVAGSGRGVFVGVPAISRESSDLLQPDRNVIVVSKNNNINRIFILFIIV
jgi:hypothetical protein